MSELKAYLDRLANGRMLSSLFSAGPALCVHAAEGREIDSAIFARRHKQLHTSYLNRAPLKVRTRPRRKTDAR